MRFSKNARRISRGLDACPEVKVLSQFIRLSLSRIRDKLRRKEEDEPVVPVLDWLLKVLKRSVGPGKTVDQPLDLRRVLGSGWWRLDQDSHLVLADRSCIAVSLLKVSRGSFVAGVSQLNVCDQVRCLASQLSCQVYQFLNLDKRGVLIDDCLKFYLKVLPIKDIS